MLEYLGNCQMAKSLINLLEMQDAGFIKDNILIVKSFIDSKGLKMHENEK